jgi:hypothetical protein
MRLMLWLLEDARKTGVEVRAVLVSATSEGEARAVASRALASTRESWCESVGWDDEAGYQEHVARALRAGAHWLNPGRTACRRIDDSEPTGCVLLAPGSSFF